MKWERVGHASKGRNTKGRSKPDGFIIIWKLTMFMFSVMIIPPPTTTTTKLQKKDRRGEVEREKEKLIEKSRISKDVKFATQEITVNSWNTSMKQKMNDISIAL